MMVIAIINAVLILLWNTYETNPKEYIWWGCETCDPTKLCCEKGETKIEMKEKNYKVFVGLCEISLLKISHD